jgi:hypothetical protein
MATTLHMALKVAVSLKCLQAHTPYRRALGPAWDLVGVKFDPLAT